MTKFIELNISTGYLLNEEYTKTLINTSNVLQVFDNKDEYPCSILFKDDYNRSRIVSTKESYEEIKKILL